MNDERNDVVDAAIVERTSELVSQYGSLRAAADAIGMDVGYLSCLARGKKKWPSDHTLRKLGLKRVISYEIVK